MRSISHLDTSHCINTSQLCVESAPFAALMNEQQAFLPSIDMLNAFHFISFRAYDSGKKQRYTAI